MLAKRKKNYVKADEIFKDVTSQSSPLLSSLLLLKITARKHPVNVCWFCGHLLESAWGIVTRIAPQYISGSKVE